MNLNKKDLQNILVKINPKIKHHVNEKDAEFTNSGLLDSLMIIKFIIEIENKARKKIKISKINKNSFSNLDNIMKFLKE